MKRLILGSMAAALVLGACHEPDFSTLEPQAMCERVQRDNVAYVGHWKITCVNGPLRNPNWMGVCYCPIGVDPAKWSIELRVDNLNPANPQEDLAYRMAHEFGHAWLNEYRGGSTEDEADEFAKRNLINRPTHHEDLHDR